MLKPWSNYAALKKPDKLNAVAIEHFNTCPPEWFVENEYPRIVGLKKLHELRHQGKGLVLLPAYSQARYIYETHAINEVDLLKYKSTLPIERVNQFDELGPCYREDIEDIFVDYRLGCIISDAAAYVAESVRVQTKEGEQGNVALMVIDALRTVDAGYLLARSNPKALEDKLLAAPGTSAHNKAMAVDLTLVYWDTKQGCWVDADMLGHMDHPDMITNHRNYHKLSHIQRSNRLQLERVMLKAAWNLGTVLAPLREEFWDFRFPEDGLDLWRVLESIARIVNHEKTLLECNETLERIRSHFRAGEKELAYKNYDMTVHDFIQRVKPLLEQEKINIALQELLSINEVTLQHICPVYHGNVNVIYDADLPAMMKQSHPKLHYMFRS